MLFRSNPPLLLSFLSLLKPILAATDLDGVPYPNDRMCSVLLVLHGPMSPSSEPFFRVYMVP